MSGYKKKVNGLEIEMGTKSQILGVSLKDLGKNIEAINLFKKAISKLELQLHSGCF